MKNNLHMTNEEMTEIAYSIITGKPLQEDLTQSLTRFLDNYEAMKDVLYSLQDYLKTYASKNSSSRLMGNGNFTKAFNASKKVDNQLSRMNQDARDFVVLMKDVIKDNSQQ